MDDNWIVENLENALATWNEKLAEIWQLVSTTPQEFKGGGIWNIVVQINGALQAIGYGLLVLFFAMGLFKNTVKLSGAAPPGGGFAVFPAFLAAKAAVTYCMPLMLAVFDICGGIVSTVAGQMVVWRATWAHCPARSARPSETWVFSRPSRCGS